MVWWHWSFHPARCMGTRAHLGTCSLEESAQGS